ncbi:MAG: hypothetical protein JNK67_24705 [Alphaproteobacteria bacterium]|nr:hypothetical protein [Alphaproteobacteria bacterium]
MPSSINLVTIAVAFGLLSACSSIVDGTTQQIAVNTNPAGAECGFYRQAQRIATIASTPASALVDKTKHDIAIVCVREGHQQTVYQNKSGVAGATFGNIILGGGIGWAIDSASGADNKYDSPVNMTLLPANSGPATPKTPLPATYP